MDRRRGDNRRGLGSSHDGDRLLVGDAVDVGQEAGLDRLLRNRCGTRAERLASRGRSRGERWDRFLQGLSHGVSQWSA